jgi:cellulose synthase/poly-beta-1,6-N-acetylglucosamine synthase-like glycosyltransferase
VLDRKRGGLGIYQFWYSPRSGNLAWFVVYMHLIEREDSMIHVEVTPSATSFNSGVKSVPDYAGSLEGSGWQENVELVSVVIPSFNARSTIREALMSVQSQTYRNLDIVIVDDASTDGTLDAVADLAETDSRVRLIRREQNGGIPSTRNIGINASRGVYLSFLDADDLWHPDKIRLQVEKMRECGPEVAVVY